MPNQFSRASLGLLLTPVVFLAQSPQPQPTFRSGVQNIEVDVRVNDQKGNPVRGLTKDDFILIEDGEAQRITSFSFVDLPIEPPAARAKALTTPESDIATNQRLGRLYVMVFDHGGPIVRLLARQFVEEAMGPDDELAVVHTGGTMSAAQGFTTSRTLLLAAIDRLTLQPEAVIPATPDNYAAVVFGIVEEMVQRLGLMPGRRKVVLWFDPPSFFIRANSELTGTMASATHFAQRDMIRAATRNNVAFYVVSSDRLTTVLGDLEHRAGMQVLPDDTGGDIIVNTNNIASGYERFVRDNSTYYLLAYEPTVEHRDGRFHKFAVRVRNRPELTVRARTGYYAPDPDSAVKEPAVVEGLSREAADAVRRPSSGGDLGIDLFAAPFKGDGVQGSVLIGAQLRGADLVLGGNARIEVAFQGTNTEGTITPGTFKVYTLDFTPESRAGTVRTGLRVIERLSLPRGRHQVRFAVHQPNGKTGSVVADVEVPDYKAALTLSGVVLGSQQTDAHRTLVGDERMQAVLGGNPTAIRRFARRDVIAAFGEVYTDPRQPQARVTVRVTPAKGGRARVPDLTVVPGEPGRTGYVIRLRLSDLAPGDYVLTVDAATPRATTMRQIPFAVTSD